MIPARESSCIPSAFMVLETALSAEGAKRKPFLDRLMGLYTRMDHRYNKIADFFGFHCRGCEESCCKTTFYHHTLMEYLCIREGVLSMEKKKRAELLFLSRVVSANENTGRFCPLNEEGRCLLYEYRPMICRLHGIAHELRRPDGTVLRGPGCAVFDAVSAGKKQMVLDRTEFYWELSVQEREARMAFGFSHKIRMTISQMVETILTPPFRKKGPSHEAD